MTTYMKKNIYIFLMLACSGVMAQQHEAQPADSRKAGVVVNPNAPEITFTETTHEFGILKKGSSVTYKFIFMNTGKEDLILYDCKKGCNCTTVKYTQEPVKPGKTGFIEVHYDSTRIGHFSKELLVTSNAKTPVLDLYIKGTIEDAQANESAPVKKDDNMKRLDEKKSE